MKQLFKNCLLFVISFIPCIIGGWYGTELVEFHHPIIGCVVLLLGMLSNALFLEAWFGSEEDTKSTTKPVEPTKTRIEVQPQEIQDELYEESMKEVESFLGER